MQLNFRKEEERFERMLKYLVSSIGLDSPKLSFIGVFLNKGGSIHFLKFYILVVFKKCTKARYVMNQWYEWDQEHSISWIKLVKDLCLMSSSILASVSTNHPNYNKKEQTNSFLIKTRWSTQIQYFL